MKWNEDVSSDGAGAQERWADHSDYALKCRKL